MNAFLRDFELDMAVSSLSLYFSTAIVARSFMNCFFFTWSCNVCGYLKLLRIDLQDVFATAGNDTDFIFILGYSNGKYRELTLE